MSTEMRVVNQFDVGSSTRVKTLFTDNHWENAEMSTGAHRVDIFLTWALTHWRNALNCWYWLASSAR